jgi:hypothetical protein
MQPGAARDIPPALQRANELMAAGDYNGASAAFEQLARGAEGRGGPRAPDLYIQAARARFRAGQSAVAMEHAKHALALLAARQQWDALQKRGQNMVTFLTNHGLKQQAQEISAHLKETLAASPLGNLGGQAAPAESMGNYGEQASPAAPIGRFGAQVWQAAKPKPRLPTVCPGCGGPLHSDELDWVDEITAECPYCGSPVRAE